MIRDSKKLAEFEDDLVKRTPVDIAQNFAIANALLAEAQRLKIIPGNDPLSGLDDEIKVIKILNAIRRIS